MNCATCRHWGDEVADDIADGIADDEDASAEQREAARRALADPLRKCSRVPFYYDPSALASTASVRDGSGYRGVLLTRSGFGCVLHEVKR